MNDSISIHRYSLVSRSGLNAGSSRTQHHGALVRVGEAGYGCIHPWPELGDMGLDETLRCLKNGETTPLAWQALQCARHDAEARRKGVSLFDGLAVPPSHATVPLDADSFFQAKEAGFVTVKVKVGRDLEKESALMTSLAKDFPTLRWRLDFNHTRSIDEVESFLRALGDELCQKIDFMEDAWTDNETPGSHLSSIPLAVDRGVGIETGQFPVWVVKPARDEIDPILARAATQGGRVVITSYMDHPLGQSFAAWQAALAAARYPAIVDICGLVTHGLFEPDAFTECLGDVGPDFHPAAGTGLGFDDLLAKLEWTPLI